MTPLHDAHNHLQDERLAPWREEILEELPRLGLKRCVVNGTCEKDWPAVEALAKRFSWIIPAFGLHPWFAKERSLNWFDQLRRLLDKYSNASVGEIGLDRWMREPDVADQEKVFVSQLELAAERNVAASIHCLKAWGHLETVLKNHQTPRRGFLLHAYGGSAEMVPIFTKLGAYFSFSGYFAHQRKADQRDVFKSISPDRFLVETDAPDMLPPRELIEREHGDVNDPRNIARITAFAVETFGAIRMEENFRRLFS